MKRARERTKRGVRKRRICLSVAKFGVEGLCRFYVWKSVELEVVERGDAFMLELLSKAEARAGLSAPITRLSRDMTTQQRDHVLLRSIHLYLCF